MKTIKEEQAYEEFHAFLGIVVICGTEFIIAEILKQIDIDFYNDEFFEFCNRMGYDHDNLDGLQDWN